MSFGVASLTIIVTVVVALPPLFAAVIVYVIAVDTDSGVPDMVPFAALRDKPFGRDGDIDQEVTVPPRLVGSSGVIAASFVN